MERSSPLDVTIIDKDESSDQAYHVVDGFVIEDSKSPFPVSHVIPSPCVHGAVAISLCGHMTLFSYCI